MDIVNLILNWLIYAAAIGLSAYIIPGVQVGNYSTALIVALVLGLINIFIRPILIFFTLPINILTLGFFTFFINAALVLLAARIVPGFKVSGFWQALIFALVLAVINYILYLIFP